MLLKVVGIYATSTHHASGSTHKKKLMGFMSDLVNGKSSFRLSTGNVNHISQTTGKSSFDAACTKKPLTPLYLYFCCSLLEI